MAKKKSKTKKAATKRKTTPQVWWAIKNARGRWKIWGATRQLRTFYRKWNARAACESSERVVRFTPQEV